jgi:hypothetical protein
LKKAARAEFEFLGTSDRSHYAANLSKATLQEIVAIVESSVKNSFINGNISISFKQHFDCDRPLNFPQVEGCFR